MAVVSISRIQLRRGRKNQGTGLPQLASGELGWAIDTQELYIGNGSVSEGAPFVGNTKLLSEYDDLFAFATNYSYRSDAGFLQTGSSPSLPVLRSLQERLDDRVSLRSFGGGTTSGDQSAIFQRAIDQLYLNPANKGAALSRVELILEPGEYTLNNTVYLPPFVTLRGAGSEKTIINTGSNVAFQTVNEDSTVGSYAADSTSTTLNQARSISLTGLTINTLGQAALKLVSCKDSLFEDLVLRGTWVLGDPADKANTAIDMGGRSTAVNTMNNQFNQVKIYNYSYAVNSDDDIRNNTFDDCEFKVMRSAVVFGQDSILGSLGQLTGPLFNTVRNSTFDDVEEIGFNTVAGIGNLSESNRYYNVGNDGGSSGTNVHPIVQFTKNAGTSHNDYFQRSKELGSSQDFIINIPYTTEVEGPQITQLNETHTLELRESPTLTRLFKLPAAEKGRGYVIDYFYRSSEVDAVRNGVMNVVVDPVNNTNSLSDEYDYTGDPDFSTSLQFEAQNSNEDGNLGVDTVVIMVLNSVVNDDAEFTYKVRYKT